MSDEQVGQTSFLFQAVEQVQYLCTDGYVQCRNRLISNDKLRLHNQSTSNTDTLSLTTGELMWETGCELRQKTYFAQSFLYLVLTIRFVLVEVVVDQTFRNDVVNLCSFIQRSHWVLENHLTFPDNFFVELFGDFTADSLAFEANFTSRSRVDSQDCTADCGFTRTGFTNQRECFSLVNIKIYMVNGNKFLFTRSKADLQIFNFD